MSHHASTIVGNVDSVTDDSPTEKEACNNGNGSSDLGDLEAGEKPDELAAARTNSMFTISSVSTIRKKSIVPVQRMLSSILDESVGPHRSSEARPWRARFMRFGPIAGIVAMIIALASIFASFGILAGSRGHAQDAWLTGPPTYLAICTAVANLAMRYACIQGVITLWWSRALRGSTIKRLQEDWSSGTSLRGALTSSRLGLMSLACIAATIVVIDGPLLQKASVVRPAPIIDQSVQINATMSQEIPTDYTGGWLTTEQNGNGKGTYWSDAFNRSSIPSAINGSARNNIEPESNRPSVRKIWAHQWIWGGTVLPDFTKGCESVCKVKIRAPALAKTACRSFMAPVNFTEVLPYNSFASASYAPPLSLAAFIIDFSLQVDQTAESIDFVTGFSHNHNGIGSINMTACNLVSAIGEYEIIITKDPPSVDSTWMPEIVAIANNTRVNRQWQNDGYYPSTLGGVVNQAYNKWASWTAYWTVKSGEPAAISLRSYTTDFFKMEPKTHFSNWTDPHERVMMDLNKLMFVTGVFVGMEEPHEAVRSLLDPNLPLETTVIGYVQGNHNVFETNYHWFIAAAVVELVCVLLILPTYWGWWNLGRPFSFSPIEIAKAFDSPILEQCNSNASGRDVARAAGDTRVQYGVTTSPDKAAVLAFARPESVVRPVKGSRFDTSEVLE